MNEEKNIEIQPQEEKQVAIRNAPIASFYQPKEVQHTSIIWCVNKTTSDNNWTNYYAVIHKFGESQVQIIPCLEGNEDLIFSTPQIFSDDPLIVDFCKKYNKSVNRW